MFAMLTLSSVYANGTSPNVLVLPKGPGSLGGIGENVSANLNMGLMSYPIKIVTPAGRNKFSPTLSITYSSSAGAGVVGIGWSLQATRSVDRLTVRGLPTYTNKDRFYGPTGEMVPVPGTPYQTSRYEGAFARYKWHQTDDKDQKGYWTAENADGSIDYYGGDRNGKVDLNTQITSSAGTWSWKLHTSVDRNGNRIEYKYFRSGTQLYLEAIEWVFSKQDKPLYRVEFTYEDRPDPISDGKPGFDLKTTKRLKEVVVYTEGQRIRSYSLEFEKLSGLSRLSKVTRYGIDPKIPYPVAFSMKYSNSVFSEKTSRLYTIPTSAGVGFNTRNADFLDINGDGLPDIVDTSNAKHMFNINVLGVSDEMKQVSHDFPKSAAIEDKSGAGAKLKNDSVQLLDVDGDGYTDIVDATNNVIYLNKGNSTWDNKSMVLKASPLSESDPNTRFMDYNGDKKIDIVRSNGDTTTYWVNDGQGNFNKVDGGKGIGASFSTGGVRLIDMNGDGLMDAVQVFSGNLRYKKYLGYGKWSDWINVTITNQTGKLPPRPQFDDINGDGLSDMVAFLGNTVQYFVNIDGQRFAAGKSITSFKGVDIPDSTKTIVRITDINGNGSRDIVWITNTGQISYLELFSERPNLLREISNGIGQRININYGSSVYHYIRDKSCDPKKDKACAGVWKNKLPMPFTVVNTISTWASRTNQPANQSTPTSEERPQIQRVYYHHGYYDGMEKQFRGFRHAETVYDGDESVGQRKDEILFDVGDKDNYMNGRLLESIVSDGSGKIFQKVANTYGDCPVTLAQGVDPKKLEPPVRHICQKSTEMTKIEGESDQQKWKVIRNEYEYDGYGNLVESRSLGEKDKTGDEKYLRYEYILPSSYTDKRWMVRAIKRLVRCIAPPDGNNQCAEILHYYDGEAFKGLPLGERTKGNLVRTRMRMKIGEDVWVEPMKHKLDTYGNLLEYIDLSGAKRTVVWDATYSRFTEKEDVEIGSYKLTTTAVWDTRYGVITRSQNQNGHTLLYSYDNFGRLTTIRSPVDPQDKPSTRYIYEMKAPLSRIITERRSVSGGEVDRKNIQCFDGLGRKLKTLKLIGSVKDNKFLAFSHTEFNRLGLNARVWDVHESNDQCSFLAPTNTNVTSFQYDGLGRLIRQTNPDKSFTRTVYGPLMKTMFDEEDNRKESAHFNTPKIMVMDGLGRTIREVETLAAGKTISTLFEYTALNHQHKDLIKKVTFDDGTTKTHDYDLMGNITKTVDPDRSETNYTYDTTNRLAEVVDPRGKITVYTHDPVGRMKTVQEKGKPETKITYNYDVLDSGYPSATNLKGRLSSIKYPTGSYYFSYDTIGQVIGERHNLMGVDFDFKRTYDTEGELSTKTLPDGRVMEWSKDAAGRALGLKGLIDTITYNKDNTIQSWQGSNGITTSYTYNTRKWPTQVNVGQGKVLTLDYTFDSIGNILALKQKHGENTFTNTYQYDGLYRLTQAKVGTGQETIDYQQNNNHNIVSKISSLGDKSPVHMGEMVYDTKRIHQLKQANNIKLNYDDSGNITQSGKDQMAWDYMSRCTSVKRDGKTVARYWYGNHLVRTIKEANGLHTFYVEDLFTIREGEGITYVKMGMNRIISVHSSKIQAKFFDDVAPLEGDTPKADGTINVADAWVYHATREKILNAPLKKRPIDLNLTQDMLMASVNNLLRDNKDETYFHHADQVGSVRAVTNAAGDVVSRTHYYPYGKTRTQTGMSFAYGYMNSEWEPTTKTHRFALRTLDPTTGRWTSPDPAFQISQSTGDEFNSYGLVLNNPIKLREFQGTESVLGVSSDTWTAIKDWSIVGVAVLGLGYTAYNMIKMVKDTKGGFSGMNAAKSSKFVGQGLMSVSWALWGATAAARQQGASDQTVQNLNTMMMAFWGAAEATNAISTFLEHKNLKKKGKQGQKGLVVARSLIAVTTITLGVLSTMDGETGRNAQTASMFIFILSAVATPKGFQALKSFGKKIGKVFSKFKGKSSNASLSNLSTRAVHGSADNVLDTKKVKKIKKKKKRRW